MATDEKRPASPAASGENSTSSAHNTANESNLFSHQIIGDEALKLIDPDGPPIEIDEATNRRLLRNIDIMLMPIFCFVYGLNFLDKTTLSYASITGIQKDIGLKGDNYQWLGSVFYLGYLGFEYPAVRLLQRLPLAKYSAACIIGWGAILTAFADVHDFAGAVVIRLLLGMFEASVSPAWTLFSSQATPWYRKEEQGWRTACWFSANGYAQIFGGLIAYGITHGSKVHGYEIPPWRIIFVFTGVLTIVFGFIFLVVIPDNQSSAWWLSREDRRLAIERVRVNQQGIGNKTWRFYQIEELLKDPIIWALFLLSLTANIPNGGLTNFFSLLIESFGYTDEESLLYGGISGAIELVGVYFWAATSSYTNNRLLVAIIPTCIALTGSILLVSLALDNNKGRLAGFYLAQLFTGGNVATFSLLATNVAGYTKKTTVAGLYFIAYCAGNVIGPQTFRPSQAPNYQSAKIAIVVCQAIDVLLFAFPYLWYKRRNGQKEKLRNSPGYKRLANQEFLDLTDMENPEFVYVL